MIAAIPVGVLVTGALALLVLDIRERFLNWPDGNSAERLRIRSGVFLVLVILVYSVIQFGGLALVPGVSDVLAMTQGFFAVSSDAMSGSSPAAQWKIVLIGIVAF